MPHVEESISSSFASRESQDDHAPLWRFVKILEKDEGAGGGNKLWSCNLCQKIVKSSYSRVKAHLIKLPGCGVAACPKVSDDILADLNRICEEAKNRLKPKIVPLPTEKLCPIPLTIPQKRRRGAIENAFNLDDRNHLRAIIVRMFYSGGLSFHLARNPYFVSSYSFAANRNLSDFLPPSYNALRTSLLKQERSHVERMLEPIKSLWLMKGVTLVFDGWTDLQRRPLVNFMAISEGGPMFLKAIDGFGDYKDKHYMARIIKDVTREIGPSNIVQIIIDNAPVYKAVRMLIEAEFPNIFWTPCVVHTLNLALKNICAAKNIEDNDEVFNECNWITAIVDDVSFIKTYIMTHSMRLAIFNEFSTLKLLSIGETRFASMIVF